jgi:hypothetical protein
MQMCNLTSLVILSAYGKEVKSQGTYMKITMRNSIFCDISEEHVASSKLLATCFMPDSHLPNSSSLKMEVMCSSELLADFQWTTCH